MRTCEEACAFVRAAYPEPKGPPKPRKIPDQKHSKSETSEPTLSAKKTLAATQWMGRPGKNFDRDLVDPAKQPTKEQRSCNHENVSKHANGYGEWKKCTKCNLRLEYLDKRSGTVARFVGICSVMNTTGYSKMAPKEVDEKGHVVIILDSGCKRSVGGPALSLIHI